MWVGVLFLPFCPFFFLCCFVPFFDGNLFLLKGGGKDKGEKKTRYLVDPARCHMLVSKLKPCMSKNEPLNGESANGSLNQLSFI